MDKNDYRNDQPVWINSESEKVSFSEEIELFVRCIGTTSTETAVKLDLVNRIKLALLQKWPRLKVKAYGSFMSGLSLVTSDIDLTIVDDEHLFENTEYALFNIFKFLCSLRRSERDPFPLAVCQRSPNEFEDDPFRAPQQRNEAAKECIGTHQKCPPTGKLCECIGDGAGAKKKVADGKERGDGERGRAACRQCDAESRSTLKMCSFCIVEHYYTKGRGVHAKEKCSEQSKHSDDMRTTKSSPHLSPNKSTADASTAAELSSPPTVSHEPPTFPETSNYAPQYGTEHPIEVDFAELPETLAPYVSEGSKVTAQNYYTDWFYPSQLEEISTARVPLIKLTDERTRCSIDITFNQTNGAENTASISALLELYPVVRPVTVLLKYLLRVLNFNEVYTGGLSAYTIAVMSAFVAQNLRQLRRCYKAGEESDCGVVLLEFLRFFGFNAELFADYGISLGDRTPNGGRLYLKSDHGWLGSHFSVEDPYDHTNDAACRCFKVDQVLSLFFDVYHVCVRRNDVFRAQPDPDPAQRVEDLEHLPLFEGLHGKAPAVPSLSIPSLSAETKYFPRRSVLSRFLFVPCEVKRQKNHYYILATHLQLAVRACERCRGGQMKRFTIESPKSKYKECNKMADSQ